MPFSIRKWFPICGSNHPRGSIYPNPFQELLRYQNFGKGVVPKLWVKLPTGDEIT